MLEANNNLNVNEVRKGIKRLFEMYPELEMEYIDSSFIDISEYNGSDGNLYSLGGIKVSKLPEPFEDCLGECCVGQIFVENILEYDESVLKGIICAKEEYDVDTGCCSYHLELTDDIDFDFSKFVPKVGSTEFSKIKKLPEMVVKYIHHLALNHKLSAVTRLSMEEETPTLYYKEGEPEYEDFGLSKVVNKWVKGVELKDVYIIIGENICNYITKKNVDGSYTITIF